ncbi:MAG TPA: transaldolase family protein [Bacteroidales bacterium]|nr:transaldolase family protein [Bacteroidales bacterium]HPF03669.1 transaldolase family protein [Bacteroidales bacterium]HPJ60636.1 transaldolase family protein [Bacteroidales bacterium]HPR13553.1 transaldolase family protein [Bacteroidales bacterium]HRW84335.1 transaldolase family protein [Bacteroidales bacterium]
MADLNTRISDFLWKNLIEKPVVAKKDPFWESLRNTGTELWLDTGDMDEAEANWTSEMSALTTNNTLLNNEIQKGIYDVFISEAKSIVRDLPFEERIKEIAFILNARHGLRLARKFGGLVSVELHTDTAHDIKAILYYGKRFHEICPDQFIVKVPYTAAGLVGARKLKEAGVKINFTLEFSARQNVLVTRVAMPDYLNVFLGRIGAFMIDNKLGDGSGAGEMAVIASQNWVTGLAAKNPWPTRLIAASLRNQNQLELLAGTDVFTMPPKVASAGRASLSGKFTSRLHENYPVGMYEPAQDAHIEKFWDVSDNVLNLAELLSKKVPETGEELIRIAHEEGCEDMFPLLGREEKSFIASDGKIPVYSRWEKKIKEGKIAPDTLLTLAGLASFTSDQKMLDDRIAGIIS